MCAGQLARHIVAFSLLQGLQKLSLHFALGITLAMRGVLMCLCYCPGRARGRYTPAWLSVPAGMHRLFHACQINLGFWVLTLPFRNSPACYCRIRAPFARPYRSSSHYPCALWFAYIVFHFMGPRLWKGLTQ